MKKIAVIGSGISGLSYAWFAQKLNPEAEIHIFEKDKWGGRSGSVEIGPFKADEWNDAIYQKTPAVEMISKELSLELTDLQKEASHDYIVKDAMLAKYPESKRGFRFNSVLFLPENLKILSSYKKTFSLWEAMSVFEAGKTLFTENFAEYFSSAFTRGYFLSEAEDTEFSSIFNDIFFYMSQKESVEKSVESAASKRKTLWETLSSHYNYLPESMEPKIFHFDKQVSFSNGMAVFFDSLRENLKNKNVQFISARISNMMKKGSQWNLYAKNKKFGPFDFVYSSVDALSLARIIKETDKELSKKLNEMKYNSFTTVFSLYPAKQIRLKGHNIFIPRKEKSPLGKVTLLSNTFKHYKNKDYFLLKSFFLGDHDLFSDEEMHQLLMKELKKFTGLAGNPDQFKVFRSQVPRYFTGYHQWKTEVFEKVNALKNFDISGIDFYHPFIDQILDHSMKRAVENSPSA